MKYLVQQHWISNGVAFRIFDEKGRDAFVIDGAAFDFGNKLSFRDKRDTELAFINQKLQGESPTFEIFHSDDLQAVVRPDDFKPGKKCPFIVDSPSPDDLNAVGDFSDREYIFTREGKPVGRVSKAMHGLPGTYGVEVGRGEDEVLMLAGAMVIDLCCHAQPQGAAVPAKAGR